MCHQGHNQIYLCVRKSRKEIVNNGHNNEVLISQIFKCVIEGVIKFIYVSANREKKNEINAHNNEILLSHFSIVSSGP